MKLFKISRTKYTWRLYLLPHVKIHWIRPTVDEWHTHPWNGLSFILGWYWEQKRDQPWRLVWGWNWIKATTPHRTKGCCLTLFIHGRRVNEDWFWGDKKAPWRGVQYMEESHEDGSI